MLREGTRVQKLTKRVGQSSPTGRIQDVRGDAYEVKWDDGHMSVITQAAVVRVKPAARK